MSRHYQIKEAFYSLQGEGAQAGRPAVFCRFTGCNLWSGRESDRADAACPLCDTDFVGIDGQNGGRFNTAERLAEHLSALWPAVTPHGKPYVIFTGGEPLLQLDVPLIESMHAQGFEVGVETNGTLLAPSGIDWLCVSPKGNNKLRLLQGNELKLVYPQPGIDPADFESLDFQHFVLQPLDGRPQGDEANHAATVLEYCLAHPRWRMGIQLHKYLEID